MPTRPTTRSRIPRWLVLGSALATAWVAFALTSGEPVREPHPARFDPPLIGIAVAADTPAPKSAAPAREAGPATPAPDSVEPSRSVDAPASARAPVESAGAAGKGQGATVTIDDKGIRIEGGGRDGEHGARNRAGKGSDQVALDQVLGNAHTGMAFVVTILAIVFGAPVLMVALVIAYKIRRNRMLHETLILLAEKGALPPGDVVSALATGNAPTTASVVVTTDASAPTQEHARVIRHKTAWSDLRKGVMLAALGLGFVLYSALHDASPSGFGLVLLCLGIGYGVLWYFEDRQIKVPDGTPPGDKASGGP